MFTSATLSMGFALTRSMGLSLLMARMGTISFGTRTLKVDLKALNLRLGQSQRRISAKMHRYLLFLMVMITARVSKSKEMVSTKQKSM